MDGGDVGGDVLPHTDGLVTGGCGVFRLRAALLLPGGELSLPFLTWPRFVRSNTAFMLLIILFVRSAAYCFLTL